MKRGDICPKCAIGKLSRMRYVAAVEDGYEVRSSFGYVVQRFGRSEPEHLFLECTECGYVHKMPTADSAGPMTAQKISKKLRGCP